MAPLATSVFVRRVTAGANQTREEHSCLILSAVAATLIAYKKRRYAFFLLI